jgi:hypothetical protein
MQPADVQQNFFERLKAISPNEQLAINVAKVLNISSSEAYKKIGGKSLLNIEQIQLLCDKFQIGFEYDPALSRNKALFSYTPFSLGKGDVEKYLDNLYNNLLHIRSVPDSHIICSTEDIPMFHLFQFAELSSFKLFFWESRVGSKNKKTALFSAKTINKKLVSKCFNLYKEYMGIAGTEIWTNSSFLSTLYQLEYAIEARLITDRTLILQLCDQLEQSMREVEGYAINEARNTIAGTPVPFKWYLCENIGSTIYLAKMNDHRSCFQRFNTFNNLQTTDEIYCDEVEQWMNSLIKESICISGQGEKERNKYIDQTMKSINRVREKV